MLVKVTTFDRKSAPKGVVIDLSQAARHHLTRAPVAHQLTVNRDDRPHELSAPVRRFRCVVRFFDRKQALLDDKSALFGQSPHSTLLSRKSCDVTS